MLTVKSKGSGLKYYPSRDALEGQRRRVTVLREDEQGTISQIRQDLQIFGVRASPVDPDKASEILPQPGKKFSLEKVSETASPHALTPVIAATKKRPNCR